MNKKNTEKKLAAILAGSLITCALHTDKVSANTVNTQDILSNTASIKDTAAKDELLPNVTPQKITFNKTNPQDLVINNIDFGDTNLKSFSIEGNSISLSDLIISTNSITIPSQILLDLNFENGLYSTRIEFLNGGIFVNSAKIVITDTDSVVTPPADNIEIISPNIEKQTLSYDYSNPSEVIITNVNFAGTTLKSIYINENYISGSELVYGNDTIIIPTDILSKFSIPNGTYDISFKFSNNDIIASKIYLNVTGFADALPPTTDDSINDDDSADINTPVLPPAVDDSINDDDSANINTPVLPPVAADSTNTLSVAFDKNNPAPIEITNIIPIGTKVNSIRINNKEVAVIYPILRTLSNTPAVYVVNDKLIIPVETLEYIGFDNSTYEISITLEDGQTISKNIVLNLVDSSTSVDNITTPTSTNNTISVEDTEENTVAADTNVTTDSNFNISAANTNNTNTIINNTDTTTSAFNHKVESNKTENISSLPNTGSAVNTSLIGTLLTAIGSIFATRKKK